MTASVGGATGRRGGPLVMLVLLLSAWTGARALWWENPFAAITNVLATRSAEAPPAMIGKTQILGAAAGDAGITPQPNPAGAALRAKGEVTPQVAPHKALQIEPQIAMRSPAMHGGAAMQTSPPAQVVASNPPPFLPAAAAPGAAVPTAAERWSLDLWGFARQGSNAAPISQGRVPVYGASQIGAVLQYRLAPAAARDPRLYARAYRAMVRRGETELALGASARPVPRVPVRVAGELRFTDTAFQNEIRPSAYAVTELAPIALALGARIEAYGQAGWVGGASDTAFADGQAIITRELPMFRGGKDDTVRLSIGAAAWGGVQQGAQRIDIGPTVRLDLAVGDVPARLSLDWREQVAGQVAPDSGLALTLSTRF